MDFFRVLKRYGRRKKPGNHRLIRPSLQFFLFLTLALTLPSGVLAQSSAPPPACSVAQQSSGLVAVTFNPNYGSGAITNQCAAQGVTFACGTGACSFEPYGGTQAEVGGGAVGASMSVTFVNPSAPSEPAAPVSVSFDVQYITAPASPICCGSAAAAPAAAKQMRVTYYDLNGKVIATQNQAIGNQVGYSFHFSFSPTTGPGVHSYAISLVGGPFTIAPFFFLKDLAYQPKYALQATNQTPHLLIKGKPPTPEIAYLGTSAAKTAHLTLGGTYRIGFGMVTPISSGKKRAFHPISSKFTLGKAHLKNQGDFDPSALFPGGAVIRYVDEYKGADGKSAGEVVLQAVHLGTQTLTITPKSKDSTVKRVKVTVSVLAPATLGTTHLKLDRRLIKLASDTGVPPQMIKGQIAQEGEFNPMAWRYEPFNLTTGDFAFSRKPHDLRTVPPRSLFRLPTIGDITDPGNCHRAKGKGKKRPKGKKSPYDYGLY